MKRTTAVIAFFVAALLAGLFVNSTLLASSPAIKEKFMQKEKGMPVETGPVQGFSGMSPLLGAEPASQKTARGAAGGRPAMHLGSNP